MTAWWTCRKCESAVEDPAIEMTAWWTCRKCESAVEDPATHVCPPPPPDPEPLKVVPERVLLALCPYEDCGAELPEDSTIASGDLLVPGEVYRCWNCWRRLIVAQPRD